MILTQPVPSMQSEADTMKLFAVKGGSDAGQTKNPLKNNTMNQRFYSTFSRPSSQSTERIVDLSPQKSERDLAQNNTVQNKTIVKLQRKQKKAMMYSNTVKQFPLFEAQKKQNIQQSKAKREDLNLSKINSVGFVTSARSVSGGKRNIDINNNKDQKNNRNSYCNSANSQTISNRPSYVGSSMRQSPLPLREYSFGSISGKGASKGIIQSLGHQDNSIYQIKPVNPQKESPLVSKVSTHPPKMRKINIIKPTEPIKQISNQNFLQPGYNFRLHEIFYNSGPSSGEQGNGIQLDQKLNRTISDGCL